jgi:drug/metabolite transporter (DMT)-like permease
MWIGTLFGLGSALSWACANVSIKIAGERFGTWGALVWAQLIGGAIALVAAAIVEGAPGPVADTWIPLVAAGIAACAAYGGLFASLRLGQVAVVTPIISAWSLISVIYAVTYSGAALTRLAAVGVALVVIGNAVLARSGVKRGGATPPIAIALAGLSALGFGVMVPMIDLAGAQVGRLWAIPFVWGIELTLAVPVLWWLGLLKIRPTSGHDWWVAGRSAAFEVSGFICLSLGLSHASVTVVSPASSLSTAISVALGLLFLHERVRGVAIAGAFMASAGIVLINF